MQQSLGLMYIILCICLQWNVIIANCLYSATVHDCAETLMGNHYVNKQLSKQNWEKILTNTSRIDTRSNFRIPQMRGPEERDYNTVEW